jgi:hypothetical protein
VESEEAIVVALSSMGVLAGVAVIWMAMQSRRQIREMEHRERLAMIERGILPAPELDPAAFERRLTGLRPPDTPGAVRARSSGVIMISIGLAFMFMISFAAGSPSVGIGIGGAFALVGAGFFINSMLIGRAADSYHPPAPLTPAEPRRNNASEPPAST